MKKAAYKPVPLTVVLFGATGDLFQKKILPALERLAASDVFHTQTEFVAYGRRVFDDSAFQRFLSLHSRSGRFLERFKYVSGQLSEAEGFLELREKIRNLEGKKERNILIYISLPPREVPGVISQLAKSGILKRRKNGYVRILIEKPFGEDLASAKKLNALLGKSLPEKNIFRIDHYLHKGMVEAIARFRIENPEFEAILKAPTVASVRVQLLETGDLSSRAAFYDSVGAFLDVGQNHLLEILATITAPSGATSNPKKMQDARSAVFHKIVPGRKSAEYIRAQYIGYGDEKGVGENSKTETYFSVPLTAPTKQWKGVPLYLVSGKALPESRANVEVTFADGGMLTFRIQPNPEILLSIPKDRREGEARITPVQFNRVSIDRSGEAYEKVFKAALAGDQSRFVSGKEAIQLWKLAESIQKKLKRIPLRSYRKGTNPTI